MTKREPQVISISVHLRSPRMNQMGLDSKSMTPSVSSALIFIAGRAVAHAESYLRGTIKPALACRAADLDLEALFYVNGADRGNPLFEATRMLATALHHHAWPHSQWREVVQALVDLVRAETLQAQSVVLPSPPPLTLEQIKEWQREVEG